MLVVPRLQELGRRRNISLYSCIIDFQNKYDFVHRELLSVTLSCFGVPYMMLTVLRQVHEKACELAFLQMALNTRNGMPSLKSYGNDLRCNRFYSVALSPVMWDTPCWYAFSEHDDILRNLVHLEQDVGDGRTNVDPLAWCGGKYGA